MLTPTNRTINIANGGTALVGRTTAIGGGGGTAPVGSPSWLTAMTALNEWHPIPNTLGSDSLANLHEYSGFVLVGTRIISAAPGGHNISSNPVVGIELNVDAPAWPAPLHAQSKFADVIPDAAWNADLTPNSRHTRFNGQWMPGVRGGRVMLLGARDLYTQISPTQRPAVAGFNLATNSWDAPSAYPNIPEGVTNGGACVDDNGDAWVNNNSSKFTASTETWSQPVTSYAAKPVRYPWCNAVGKGYMFGLSFGDGWGYSVEIGVSAVKHAGNVQTQITFNPSAALNQFIADVPAEAGMDYDQVNDCFLFCSGNPAGRVYKIIPNSGTVWDMQIFTYGPNSVTPLPAADSSGIPFGIQSRIKYIAAFKGFVMLPSTLSNLLFMRTA